MAVNNLDDVNTTTTDNNTTTTDNTTDSTTDSSTSYMPPITDNASASLAANSASNIATQNTTDWTPQYTTSEISNGLTDEQKATGKSEAESAYTHNYSDLINNQYQAYAQQIANSYDYKTQSSINDATRSYQDQLSDYRKQYRNYTASMYNGMDNAALKSRASGQFGGTATANVGAVQSQYQQARQELSNEQLKLATDTMREVEDLRAQGEFDKADALMQARQEQFQALYDEATRVDENEYNAYVQNTTWNREDDAQQRVIQQSDKEYQQKLGQEFLSLGLMPTTAQLAAMGIDQATAQLYLNTKTYGATTALSMQGGTT